MGLVFSMVTALVVGVVCANWARVEWGDGPWVAVAAALAAAAALVLVLTAWPVLSLVWSLAAAIHPAPPGPVHFQ